MQQHPIPQNITTYKFRLVGDMTLKQFLELAVGIVGAWLIFNSGLNLLFKWTLGPLAAFFGVALAFIPIEDRPLDQWIINFFKAIYNPTQFTWQANTKPLDLFSPPKPQPEKTQALPTHSRQLEEYLKTLPQDQATSFDKSEQKYLEHIRSLFGALGSKTLPSLEPHTPPPVPLKSSLKGVRIRQLMTPQMCLLPHATVYQSPPETQQASMPVQPLTATAPTAKTPAKITTKTKAPPTATVKTASRPAPPPHKSSGPVSPTAFASDILFPQVPDKPNLVAGITLDQTSKIVPSVILEIRDAKGHPVRALKSNQLGQFFIATPLPDGVYEIEAEHPDHRFAIMKLEAKNEVIPPLKIQALN